MSVLDLGSVVDGIPINRAGTSWLFDLSFAHGFVPNLGILLDLQLLVGVLDLVRKVPIRVVVVDLGKPVEVPLVQDLLYGLAFRMC